MGAVSEFGILISAVRRRVWAVLGGVALQGIAEFVAGMTFDNFPDENLSLFDDIGLILWKGM